jgi:hypothetical protein
MEIICYLFVKLFIFYSNDYSRIQDLFYLKSYKIVLP